MLLRESRIPEGDGRIVRVLLCTHGAAGRPARRTGRHTHTMVKIRRPLLGAVLALNAAAAASAEFEDDFNIPKGWRMQVCVSDCNSTAAHLTLRALLEVELLNVLGDFSADGCIFPIVHSVWLSCSWPKQKTRKGSLPVVCYIAAWILMYAR